MLESPTESASIELDPTFVHVLRQSAADNLLTEAQHEDVRSGRLRTTSRLLVAPPAAAPVSQVDLA